MKGSFGTWVAGGLLEHGLLAAGMLWELVGSLGVGLLPVAC